MYSKAKGMTRADSPVPPPGYDGSRFRKRSDGRDEAFLAAYTPPVRHSPSAVKEAPLPPEPPAEEKDEVLEVPSEVIYGEKPAETAKKRIAAPTKKEISLGIGNEELLLIALILILAGESGADTETVLLLTLLLCIS